MNATNRKLRFTPSVIAGLLVCSCAYSTDAPQWQSADSIRAAAQSHVEASVAGRSNTTRVQAATLDSRLRLPACSAPLSTETPYGRTRGTRITVRVSCTDDQGWRIHVPVETVTIGLVVATSRALARGTVLTREDLIVTESELGRLGHGYFPDPANVIGQHLKRPMPAGSVLTPAQLEAPMIIRRGQIVTIVAGSGGFGVKMRGEALEHGSIGQIIDIENSSSGRRVQGIVRSARAVEILLH